MRRSYTDLDPMEPGLGPEVGPSEATKPLQIGKSVLAPDTLPPPLPPQLGSEAPHTPQPQDVEPSADQAAPSIPEMNQPKARSPLAPLPAQRPTAYTEALPTKPVLNISIDPSTNTRRLSAEPLQQQYDTADDLVDADDDAAEEEDEATEGTTETPINTSSEDARHAELLKLQEEIEDLETAIDGLSDYYKIVDRLGEGTFSSVYKAIDLQHFAFDNDEWVSRGPLDPYRKGVCHVALKKIYVTSSPQRIFNELSIMEDLRPAKYVSYLITAFRSEDQIVAVMPYSRHRDFRDYYREMPLGDFKYYFRCLFSALQSVHEAGIMHRDIKPANFLYDPSTGHGTLCDFGLAERFEPAEWRGKCHHTCPTPEHPHGTKEINRLVDSIWFEPGKPLAGQQASDGSMGNASTALNAASGDGAGAMSKSTMNPPAERVGYLATDIRHGVRANRAGTRGFRAPEVLFKCQDQTVAIDIWSAGVILLTLLIRRFPVFNSNDDVEALIEIAVIFGKTRMETCAMLHNRTFHCNVPTVSHTASLTDFIFRLNPELRNPGGHPDAEQYARDVADALDLVKSCLHVDCTRRKTAAQLLEHPFLRMDEQPMEAEEGVDEAMEEYVGEEADFADYYQGGEEHGVEGYGEGENAVMYEEDELEDAEEQEEVAQLQSRRGGQGEPSEAGDGEQSHVVPSALVEEHHQHEQQLAQHATEKPHQQL